MAKLTQQISLDVTDINGDDVHMIITKEEAESLCNELEKVFGVVTGISYPEGVRSSTYTGRTKTHGCSITMEQE